MLSLIYKSMWIILIQFTFCLADSQSPLIKLNEVETGMLLVEDEKEGYYYEIPKLKTDVKIKIDGMVVLFLVPSPLIFYYHSNYSHENFNYKYS